MDFINWWHVLGGAYLGFILSVYGHTCNKKEYWIIVLPTIILYSIN